MKHIQVRTFIASALLMLFSAGCSKILDEQPRSIYEPGFFKTESGVRAGITSLYSHLRYIYGNGYYNNTCEVGTDEATWGESADGNFKVMDASGQGNIDATSSRSDIIWGLGFSTINTASGIIENAAAVGTIPASLVAEARFFRAFDYFLLVQTFGGVSLDLGSGELKFNTSTVRTSVRNTVPEVYTKAIFPDLLTAINDLPAAPRVTGGVTKTAARLYLAKAYLTYGWWLQNPNNVPTYPAAARTDPDGHDAQWYFQQAYDVAISGIENAGTTFVLQPTYYDIHVATKDRNKEILLFADHTEKNELYNGAITNGFGNADAPGNFAGWFFTWNYTNIRSSSSNTAWVPVSSVQREADQKLGRPWVRMCPTIGVIKNTFADKINDSRYDGTFTTVYRGNWPKGGLPNPVLYNANYLPITPGVDPVLTFLNDDPLTPINYSNTTFKSNVGAGVLPGRADFVVGPDGISRRIYPGLWKVGPYRTDNNGTLGQPNVTTTRPYNVAKFSELYFIAAEAAVKGAATQAGKSARELINVIRARAGKWSFDNNGNTAKVADNSAIMVAATPATITIDYILAERSREYFGEGYRWNDLVRTQKWEELAGTYQICGPGLNDHTKVTVTRNIQKYLYLRPIPQGQLDAMQMSAEEKAKYQNPGYQ